MKTKGKVSPQQAKAFDRYVDYLEDLYKSDYMNSDLPEDKDKEILGQYYYFLGAPTFMTEASTSNLSRLLPTRDEYKAETINTGFGVVVPEDDYKGEFDFA